MLNRISLKLLKEKNNLIGVEIGLNIGENARNMLENLDIQKLYLIDPYIPYEHYQEETINKWKTIMYNEFKSKYGNDDRVVIIEKTSEEAAPEIPYGLDFVYIDGGHDYQVVTKDLELYVDKIRKGGLLCGDNFECMPVRCAVYDFIVFNGYNFKLDGLGDNLDGPSMDWWIYVL